MSQRDSKLQIVSDRGARRASRILEMLDDDVVDPVERTELRRLAREERRDALVASDVVCDFAYIEQVFRMGRHGAPNWHLRSHGNQLDRMLDEVEAELAKENGPGCGEPRAA